MCGEEFEKFYSQPRQEWMYRDAIRVGGELYKYSLWREAQENDMLPSPQGESTPAVPGLSSSADMLSAFESGSPPPDFDDESDGAGAGEAASTPPPIEPPAKKQKI